MEEMEELFDDLAGMLHAYIASAERTGDAVEKASHAEGVCLHYQAVGILDLVAGGDADAFFHHLIRSGQSRLWGLEAGQAADPRPQVMRPSTSRGLYAAMASGQWLLARRIAEASTPVWNPDHEYEEDFLPVHMIHRGLCGATPDEMGELFERYETVLNGADEPRRDLMRALLWRQKEDAEAAFGRLVEQRRAWLARMHRESELASEDWFLPQSLVFIEGLAWLQLLAASGIEPEGEYDMCPPAARRVVYTPFEVTTFPSVPLPTL